MRMGPKRLAWHVKAWLQYRRSGTSEARSGGMDAQGLQHALNSRAEAHFVDDATARGLMGSRVLLGFDEFEEIWTLMELPRFSASTAHEEGVEHVKRRIMRALKTWPALPPAAVLDAFSTDPELAVLLPRPGSRFRAALRPTACCRHACGFPPCLACAWPALILFFGLPCGYACSRPCYLAESAEAKSIVLTERALVYRDSGHKGFTQLAGPLGLCACVPVYCPERARDLDEVPRKIHAASKSVLAFGTNAPTPPRLEIYPLDLVDDVVVLDHPVPSSLLACCCFAGDQELAGLTSIVVLGNSSNNRSPENAVPLLALDAVPPKAARVFASAALDARARLLLRREQQSRQKNTTASSTSSSSSEEDSHNKNNQEEAKEKDTTTPALPTDSGVAALYADWLDRAWLGLELLRRNRPARNPVTTVPSYSAITNGAGPAVMATIAEVASGDALAATAPLLRHTSFSSPAPLSMTARRN